MREITVHPQYRTPTTCIDLSDGEGNVGISMLLRAAIVRILKSIRINECV